MVLLHSCSQPPLLMVHSSTSGSENKHYHKVLCRVLLIAEYLSLSALESKIPAYIGFNTGIFLGGGNADICNGHMHVSVLLLGFCRLHSRHICNSTVQRPLPPRIFSSMLICRWYSREKFPCAMVMNVRKTKIDRCLFKDWNLYFCWADFAHWIHSVCVPSVGLYIHDINVTISHSPSYLHTGYNRGGGGLEQVM